jgi:copper transport protein
VPAAVTLVFSEPVTPAGTGIRVFSPSGRQVAAPTRVNGSVLSASLSSGELGTYVVSWQVFASDTHPSRGAFSFAVGRPSANPYSALLETAQIGTATPLGLALQALARWVHFAGFALVFGVAAYRLLTQHVEGSTRLVGAGVVLLIAAEPLTLVAQLASLSFDGDTAIAVLGSGFGRLLALRLGAALLVWTLLATNRTWPLIAIGAVVALLDGAGAHAIPGLPGAGEVLVAIHVSAMGLWVGGLAAFLRSPDRRFGRYAAWTLGAAIASGALLAIAHTAAPSALIATDYGRALLLKILVVGAALVAAARHRHRLEVVLAMLVLTAATVVASLPPSR